MMNAQGTGAVVLYRYRERIEATLVAPFLDSELERSVNNPLLYEVVRVSQLGPDGVGPTFDRAPIEAWQAR